jgi:beta-fructofuranosidase
VPTDGGLLDHGHDFYAPAFLAEDDRVLLWGWSWEDRDPAEVVGSGWAGVLTWPRTLSLSAEGRVLTFPAAELSRLRLGSSEAMVEEGLPLPLPEGPLDVELVVGGAERVSFQLHGADTQLGVVVDLAAGTVEVERDVYVAYRRDWVTKAAVRPGDEELALRLVVDGALVELYVHDGPTFTERLYLSGAAARELRLEGAGRARATVHRLAPAVG